LIQQCFETTKSNVQYQNGVHLIPPTVTQHSTSDKLVPLQNIVCFGKNATLCVKWNALQRN